MFQPQGSAAYEDKTDGEYEPNQDYANGYLNKVDTAQDLNDKEYNEYNEASYPENSESYYDDEKDVYKRSSRRKRSTDDGEMHEFIDRAMETLYNIGTEVASVENDLSN